MRIPITLSMAALLLLAGCSAVITVEEPEVSSPDAQATQPDSSPEAKETERDTSDAEGDQSASSAVDCSADLQALIQASINSQTEAFAAEDFQLAYSFASPEFQKNIDLQAFINVISSSYGPLLSSSKLQFSNCYVSQDQSVGVIDVRFIEGSDALYALRYFLVFTEEGWRVEGASDLELVASGS